MSRIVLGFCRFILVVIITQTAVSYHVAASRPDPLGGEDLQHRKVYSLNTHWLFTDSDDPAYSDQSIDESGFERISVPHENRLCDTYGGPRNGGFDQTQFHFVSWYRRHFSIPDDCAGSSVLLEFQGVATVTTVYVNGRFAGEHRGAYTSFTFDITDLVVPGYGIDNVIAVRCDSTRHGDIPPERWEDPPHVDFLLFGGIVRDVRMIIVNPIHAEWVYATTPIAGSDSAVLRVRTRVTNRSDQQRISTVASELRDATGQVVTSTSTTETVPAMGYYEFEHACPPISNPHLWDIDDPYLYTLHTTVQSAGVSVDDVQTHIGIRHFEFSDAWGDGRFMLNGRHVQLFGLNRHEQYPFIGRAACNRLQKRDADLLKFELGCNIVRTSHYPQDPEFLSRCDEIGLLVMEEIPGWANMGDGAYQNLIRENVYEMVMRDRNHPSIITWGVRINESGENHDLYTDTNSIARNLDPTRPTSGARYYTGTEYLEDLFTYNDYYNSQHGLDPSNINLHPAESHLMPWLVSEVIGFYATTMSWSGESERVSQMLKNARAHHLGTTMGNICGVISWCAFDYQSNPPFGTYQLDYHGVSDIFREPKFAAWFYKSQRDPAVYGPVVYIAHEWRGDSPMPVYVAGNCEEVELKVNGVSKGRIAPNSEYHGVPHPLFVFSNVNFEAGQVVAEGYIGGQQAAAHARTTPGPPTRLVLHADDASLFANGYDQTRVLVEAVDANGQRVVAADPWVTIALSGDGTFQGQNPVSLEGGCTAFYVQSLLDEPGEIICTATATGLAGSDPVSIAVIADPSAAFRLPLPSDCPPVDPPTQLASVYSGIDIVELTWLDNAIGVDNEDAYVIHRKPDSGIVWETIATLPADSTGYTSVDAIYTVYGLVTYQFRVGAVKGDRIAWSTDPESTSITTPTDNIAPTAPDDLIAIPGAGKVELSWCVNTEDDAESYNVYRSQSISGEYLFIGTTSSAFLTDTDVTNGTTYYYRISAVDRSGNESTWSQSTSCTPQQTGLLREVWEGIPGSSVSDLTTHPDYPDSPTSASITHSGFEYSSGGNWTENYGTRVRGHLVPTVTGDYTFWIASDDSSELWMNVSGEEENGKSLIAFVIGWTDARQWDKYPADQQSGTYPLEAGRRYYVELLHKEGANADHYAVAWQGPGISRTVIADTYTRPWSDAPAAPSNLQIDNITGDSITLSWQDNASDEAGFTIQRRPYAGSLDWHDLKSVTADTTTFTDTDQLHGLVQYHYRVGAF